MLYAPRDLKGATIKFTFNGRRYTAFQLSTVQAAHLINAENPSYDLANLIINDKYFENDIVGTLVNGKLQNIDYQATFKNIIQHQLEDLEKGVLHDRNFTSEVVEVNGNQFTAVTTKTVTDVEVEAGECIMGKMNAEKFGLVEGDRIDQILKQGADFFYNRFQPRYGTFIDIEKDMYDGVIYTSEGPIFIRFNKITDPKQLEKVSINSSITRVEDDLVLGNYVLGKASGKTAYTYNAGEKQYHIIAVDSAEDLQELLKSEISDTIR